MKGQGWKVVAWVAAFLAAAETLWLVARYPTGSDAFRQEVQQVIERHQARYLGDLTTRQFHRLNCKEAAAIPDLARVLFLSRKAALEMGFTPCPQCRP